MWWGTDTASKLPDAQAAAESADSMHSTALAGANFVLQAAGWLESGLVSSFEKLLIDADRLDAYQILLSGMAVDDNSLGRQAFEEIKPAGHYLGSAHTMANYQTAFYESQLSDSESFEQWNENGEQGMVARANSQMHDMLAAYQLPPIDPAVNEELCAYVAKRKEQMPDAWY